MVRPFGNAPNSSKQIRFRVSSESAQTIIFSRGPDPEKFSSGWTGGQNWSLVTSGSMPQPVGRQAHNLKVIGSNPIPATTFIITLSPSRSNRRDGFGFSGERGG